MTIIDPEQSVSFSIASHPGVYALLLGSGVSRSAEIPTGWDIVRDLLGKLAASSGVSGDVDLEEWYRERYQREPEYSDLLDALARTPNERQQLLRPYFEPNEVEREQGLKQPTAAHRAIAQMVAQGLIRVIVTTNFDQLIEVALRDAGVTPTLLSTPDQVSGALPLIHTGCCVFKVHGDYTDPRILNSPTELNQYDEEVDHLLDQIFDQFGLIICGWSAEWDVALRSAIARAPSRRFTTYWASRGQLAEQAQKLADSRDAQIIAIQDADIFFTRVEAAVASIVAFSRPHPLSTQAAVETIKRYMVNREHRIRLADHIDTVVRRLLDAVGDDVFTMHGSPNQESFTARVESYEGACSTLMAIAVVAGYWAEGEHFQDWDRAIRQIYDTRQSSGNNVWLGLRNYPTYLLIHALGLGAVAGGRLDFLGRLFRVTVNRRLGDTERPTALLSAYLDMSDPDWNRLLPGMERRYTPCSDRLHDVLREPCRQLLIGDEEYSLVFDKLEILMALSIATQTTQSWLRYPLGSFFHRYVNRQRALIEIRQSLETDGDRSAFVTCDLFGQDAAGCADVVDEFESFVVGVAQRRMIWTPNY